MNVVGPVERSHVWPLDPEAYSEKRQPTLTPEQLLEGAWEFLDKIESSIRVDEYSDQVYEATLSDKSRKFCNGPFLTRRAVSEHLGTDIWAALRRFGIFQKNKIRPIDDAFAAGHNSTCVRLEKLITSSIDMIVNFIRAWRTIDRSKGTKSELGAWAMDEDKAYRQIPVNPDQRKFSVIAVVNPNRDPVTKQPKPRLEYFVMNGHCFGYTNAVYNYNRRPMAMTEILRKIFHIPTDHYYDDRWGIEPMSTFSSSFETTQEVFRLLGFDVQTAKAQGPPTVKVVQEDGSTKEVDTESKDKPWKDPELLGVTFDLEEFQVKVKETRKKELQDEIK